MLSVKNKSFEVIKMLGSKSTSQGYILHITYIVSKINIPNYTLRTTEIKM